MRGHRAVRDAPNVVKEDHMQYLDRSEEIIGYRVKIMPKEAFTIRGYTLIIPEYKEYLVPQFWDKISADGRLEKLLRASSVRPWVLGFGSWDAECEKQGFRYTICIEDTEYTDFLFSPGVPSFHETDRG